ncbi:hypothetical protein HUT16_37185 [Kitasatospora sp. NA04385]|uniref:hypothetical protein n=1 Tax=Kitasatospora sp. NA04385 TaxID=2742135 RepID=UPI00159110B8|nr:hypothetical protein [Kitasatospora sp. NA04385]QKW17674.1 hypothetical protein HUT16_00080 [Kitasatospora sp. NA04385]QKW23971.1 hypothetical protein HUT16_37185 [Kitasatospora sp. NA04385]
MGDMPPELTDPGAAGGASSEFRRLARAGLGASTDGTYRECEPMTAVERRATANTALDTLVSYRAARP